MPARVSGGARAWAPPRVAFPAGPPPPGPPALSTDTPAEGEPLVAMGVDDDGVVVVGVSLAAVNGDVLTVGGKRMLDSRFWGGPLYDGRGRLVAIGLMSLGPPKAISARGIQRMLGQRAGS